MYGTGDAIAKGQGKCGSKDPEGFGGSIIDLARNENVYESRPFGRFVQRESSRYALRMCFSTGRHHRKCLIILLRSDVHRRPLFISSRSPVTGQSLQWILYRAHNTDRVMTESVRVEEDRAN